MGIDFGSPDFAAGFLAGKKGHYELQGPTQSGEPLWLRSPAGGLVPFTLYWAYAEYTADVSRSAAEHFAEMRKIDPETFEYIVVGSMSEGQWRSEFRAAGFHVREPNQAEVGIGIERTWGLFNTQLPMVMKNCTRPIGELQNCPSRPVDDNGVVLEGIIDKEMVDGCDSLRYFGDWAARKGTGHLVGYI